VSSLESLLEIPQAIAAPLDVEDMSAVQQAIENSCGQDLVASE